MKLSVTVTVLGVDMVVHGFDLVTSYVPDPYAPGPYEIDLGRALCAVFRAARPMGAPPPRVFWGGGAVFSGHLTTARQMCSALEQAIGDFDRGAARINRLDHLLPVGAELEGEFDALGHGTAVQPVRERLEARLRMRQLAMRAWHEYRERAVQRDYLKGLADIARRLDLLRSGGPGPRGAGVRCL